MKDEKNSMKITSERLGISAEINGLPAIRFIVGAGLVLIVTFGGIWFWLASQGL